MNRRLLLVLIGVVVALVAVLVIWVLVDDDDDEAPPSGESGLETPTVPSSVAPGLSPEAEELRDLLDERVGDRYHATYVGEGDPDAVGGEITIEEWRDGERLRRDTRFEVEGEGTAESRTIVDGDDVVACTRVDDSDWTCQPSTVEADTADPVLGSVAAQLAGIDVTETATDEVDGREARCFSFAAADGPGEICVTPDGIPLRVEVGDTRLRLTGLDSNVPGETFTPPAPVS